MFLRVVVVSVSLLTGAGLSQFPEFSQQYLQRLGGAVDALEQVVSDFDHSAAAVGLSRHKALDEMNGSPFLQRRQADLRRTILRYEELLNAYTALRSGGPFTRFYEIEHLQDPQILQGTWDDFQPALPLTFEGLFFALFGFGAGYGVMKTVAKLFRPGRRRNKPTAA
ncbi:DUF2937 family protein [Donghicola mangrovi]|uniref:DUF2937 family protein n=1 Tax=Donghicola mangrovi TaxID=2729614 RepID=A0A850Q8X0_9RHOB|nr:DUF2937 family protein [Donghicola mangrovi]NVO23418.1 DUF2937 family protein [Donghicola mangrovi]